MPAPTPTTLLEQLRLLRASRFPTYDAAVARCQAARLAVDDARKEQQLAEELVRQFGGAPAGLDYAIREVEDALALPSALTDAEATAILEDIK